MQRHAHPRTNHHIAAQCVGDEIIKRLIDARDIYDDSGKQRHNSYEITQPVAALQPSGRSGLQFGGFFERIKPRHLFPREVGIVATEVPVRSSATIDRALQIEVAHDGGWTQVECVAHGLLDL